MFIIKLLSIFWFTVLGPVIVGGIIGAYIKRNEEEPLQK